jgi:hypothetical protein
MLDQLADGLWVVARPQRFWGVETGTRTTVVRLKGDRLFVHSPVALDDTLRAAIDARGSVAAVVAPSLFHHLYVGQWHDAYPDARLFCCPRLEQKRKDVAWHGVLGDAPEPEWKGELDQVHFSARSLENEVVFHHAATRTMICADAIFNLRQHPSRFTRFVATLLGNDKPGATYLEPWIMRDRDGARNQLERMLAWHPERIVLAHGDLVESRGTEVLALAYAWLLR